MALSNLFGTIRDGLQWCFHKIIAPVLRRTAGVLLHWSAAGKTPDPADPPEQWKQKALDDFTSWLTALPDLPPDGEPGPQACDLYTLLTEFAALRQEIRLQNRQQHTTIRTQEKLVGQFQEIAEQLNIRIAHLSQVQDAQRRSIEESAVLPFLDIRDALLRGAAAADAAARPRAFWRRAPKGMHAVAEGYALALRRFDRTLDRLGIRPIECVGRPFDAACMRAVEKRRVGDKDQGIVIEQIAGGFTRDSEVLRPAEVIVNSE
jgi:molecular chaperone GrpE